MKRKDKRGNVFCLFWLKVLIAMAPIPIGVQCLCNKSLLLAHLFLWLDCELLPTESTSIFHYFSLGSPGSKPWHRDQHAGWLIRALRNIPWRSKGEKAERGRGNSWAAVKPQQGPSQPCGKLWSRDGPLGGGLQTSHYTRAPTGRGSGPGWGSPFQPSQLQGRTVDSLQPRAPMTAGSEALKSWPGITASVVIVSFHIPNCLLPGTEY